MKGSFTQDLIVLIGYPATRKLIATYPGQHVYFPAPDNLETDHHLAQAVGYEAALTLCREYSGLRLLIPIGRAFLRAERNQAIRQRRDAGATHAELVREFDLCPRSIREILANTSTADLPSESGGDSPAQLNLF